MEIILKLIIFAQRYRQYIHNTEKEKENQTNKQKQFNQQDWTVNIRIVTK